MSELISEAAIKRMPILTEAAIAALTVADPEAGRLARWARVHSPAARRLDTFKRKAAESVATILKHHADSDYRAALIAQFGDWKRQRYPRKFHGGRWSNDETGAYYVDSFDSDMTLRNLGTAADVSKREGSRAVESLGWYVDDMQSETVSGYVLQLPARNGKPQYIPALAWTDRDGVTLYPLDVHEESLEAARAADSYAETTAESEREYSEAWAAGSRAAGLLDDAKADREQARILLAELRQLRGDVPADRAPVACQAIRRTVAGLLEGARDNVAHAREMVRDFHDMRGNRGAELESAFDEVAGGRLFA